MPPAFGFLFFILPVLLGVVVGVFFLFVTKLRFVAVYAVFVPLFAVLGLLSGFVGSAVVARPYFDRYAYGLSKTVWPVGVGEVRAMQVAGYMLLVAAHTGRDASDWGRDKPANTYVAIDTKASKTTNDPTLEALRLDAASRGISLNLIPTEEALGRAASPGWAGRIFLVLLLTPPAVLAAWLLRKLRQLQQCSTVLGQQPHAA
jgi:hypothetical protein